MQTVVIGVDYAQSRYVCSNFLSTCELPSHNHSLGNRERSKPVISRSSRVKGLASCPMKETCLLYILKGNATFVCTVFFFNLFFFYLKLTLFVSVFCLSTNPKRVKSLIFIQALISSWVIFQSCCTKDT